MSSYPLLDFILKLLSLEVIQHTLSFASLFPKPQLHCDKLSWVRESVKQTVWYFLIFCLTSWALPSKLLWRPAHKHPFPKTDLWEEAKKLKHPQQQASPGAVIYSDSHTKHFLSDARWEESAWSDLVCVSRLKHFTASALHRALQLPDHPRGWRWSLPGSQSPGDFGLGTQWLTASIALLVPVSS